LPVAVCLFSCSDNRHLIFYLGGTIFCNLYTLFDF
jgi:hypothetical protein